MRKSILICLVVATACRDAGSPAVSLSVGPSELGLWVGDTARVSVTDARVRVAWRSAAPTIATVDASGLVTAVTPGVTKVWAVRVADSASSSVTVLGFKKCAGAPRVSPPNATLVVGDSTRLAASEGCSSIAGMTDWMVTDPTVATVAARGVDGSQSFAVVTGLRAGTAVITARSVADPSISVAMALTVRTP